MPKAEMHALFERLLASAGRPVDAMLGLSLSHSPVLGDFLADLDPNLSLDWNGQSFQGLPSLREAVIRSGTHGPCTPSDVLITAGAAEANYLAIMQTVGPGDRVVTDRPGWPQVGVLAKAIGAELVEVRRDESDGWSLDLSRLEEAARGARMVFLTNPSNPTGRHMGAEEMQALAAIADRTGAWMLVDEVYAGLEWDRPRAPSIAALTQRGIATGSVSKALGLQGLRTGWLICRDPGLVMDAVIRRENGSEIMNVLGEHIAEIALRPDRLAAALDTARAEALEALATLDAFVRAQPRLSWHPPEAGLIGLARYDGNADTLADTLLDAGTFVFPGSVYGMPRHLRLGVGGGPGAGLETGLDRLAAALAPHPS